MLVMIMKPGSAASGPPTPTPVVDEFPAEVEVCRRFAPRVRAIALRHLRDRSLADDVVQEVLASVVVALREGRIERPELVGPYVLSTCRRRIADAHRTEARRSAMREELVGLDRAVLGTPCVEERRLDLDRAVLAFAPLSGRERQVINETFSAERSAEEIARAIGTTANHVRVMRHRALAKMRAALGWEEGT
jgi:RNA polymerase sigma-70 factor, ECF subfamily